MDKKITCKHCMYGDEKTGLCEFFAGLYPEGKMCSQFSPKIDDGMKLKRRTSIHRADVEKAVTALQVVFGRMELDKKMRIIIDYDPQSTSVHINYYAKND